MWIRVFWTAWIIARNILITFRVLAYSMIGTSPAGHAHHALFVQMSVANMNLLCSSVHVRIHNGYEPMTVLNALIRGYVISCSA